MMNGNGHTEDINVEQVQSALRCDPNLMNTVTELNKMAASGFMIGIAVVALTRDGNAVKSIYLPPDGRLMSMVAGKLMGAAMQVEMNADQMGERRPPSPILRPPPIFGG